MIKYNLKKILILTFITLTICFNSFSRNYYISNSGSDENDGSVEKPFKTIYKVNTIATNLKPGDCIYFKSGEVFFGEIVIQTNGSKEKPVIFSSYEDGAKPIITGNIKVNNFKKEKNNIYSVLINDSKAIPVTNIIINNQAMMMSRYPDINNSNHGYITIGPHDGEKCLTAKELLHIKNLTGTFAVIRANYWILDKLEITKHEMDKITIEKKPSYPIQDGFGFFLMNNIEFLKNNGDWYYDNKNKKLYIYYNSDINQCDVEIPYLDKLLSITNSCYVNINNIDFKGSKNSTVKMNNSRNINLSNNIIRLSATDAVILNDITNIDFNSNTIDQSNNNGISAYGLKKADFISNKISTTGTLPGMGQNGDCQYIAVALNGDDIVFKNNEITKSGYLGLNFNGNNIEITNNYFNEFCFVKNDGAAIYTWSDGKTEYKNRIINGNIILNGINIAKGTISPSNKMANGIYIDDRQCNVIIKNNFITKCNGAGIMIHNTHNVEIINNTIVDNYSQISMIHDAIALEYPIHDIKCKNNYLFSKSKNDFLLSLKSIKNDIKNFGSFYGNKYSMLADGEYISYSEDSSREYKWNYSITDLKKISSTDKNLKTLNYGIKEDEIEKVIEANRYKENIKDNNNFYVWSNFDTASIDRDESKNLISINFNKKTNNADSYAVLVCPLGKVSKGKNYLLKYSISGKNANSPYKVIFRKNGAPYYSLTPDHSLMMEKTKTSEEILLTSDFDEEKARIDFEFYENTQNTTLYDISFYEVQVKHTNLDDYTLVLYNKDNESKNYKLEDSYFDLNGNNFKNQITLSHYEYLFLIKKL